MVFMKVKPVLHVSLCGRNVVPFLKYVSAVCLYSFEERCEIYRGSLSRIVSILETFEYSLSLFNKPYEVTPSSDFSSTAGISK